MIDVNPRVALTEPTLLPSLPCGCLLSNWVNYWKTISIAKSSFSWPAEMCQDTGAWGTF